MSKNNNVLLYHLLFGGKIKNLVNRFGVSKSAIHRILDEAKTSGLYDWSVNKEGQLTSKLIEEHGEDVINHILSLALAPEIVESKIKTYKKVVALPDIHYPCNIPLGGIEKFLADYQPDILIYLGDVMELHYLSFFEKNNKLIIGDKLRKEYDEVMKLMDKHIRLSKASEVYYIEGNHEFRVRKFLESYPAGTGFIEIPIAMKLKERGITWIELNKWVRIGKLSYTHGIYYNMYHARKHVDTYHTNIMYGHVHARQLHSSYHPFDSDIPHVAEAIGCLCNLNPPYMKNRPNQWANSFNYTEIEESGLFFGNTVPMIRGDFRITGLTSRRYTCNA